MIWFNFHTVKTTTTNRIRKKAWEKNKTWEKSFCSRNSSEILWQSLMSEFHGYKLFDATSSSSSSSSVHQTKQKKRKTRNKTNIYRRKQNENPYGIYSIDYIPFSTFFRHYSPYIFLSKIDYIGNKRGDYYSINQNDCFIRKLFQFILLMDV